MIADELKQAIREAVAELQIGATPVIRWLDVQGAAAYTSSSEATIRRLLSAGKITAYRAVRGKISIDRHELDSYFASCDQRPRKGRGIKAR